MVQLITEASIPGTWRLFQTMKGMLQLANMMRMTGIAKSRWLLQVKILINKVMKKDITNIDLTEGPSPESSQGENKTNCEKLKK
jgi:hypothetical protein